MPKMTVTTNDGRVVADFEIGDVDPVDYQPEIDEVLREAFELEGTPVPDWLQPDDVAPRLPGVQRSRGEMERTPWESAAGRD
jgi:hypothetical protein